MHLIGVFSGYIGSVSFLNAVLEVVHKLRSVNPKLTYGEYIIEYNQYRRIRLLNIAEIIASTINMVT